MILKIPRRQRIKFIDWIKNESFFDGGDERTVFLKFNTPDGADVSMKAIQVGLEGVYDVLIDEHKLIVKPLRINTNPA